MSRPDMTLSADGTEPFDSAFEEMRHLLNSLDAEQSDIGQITVSLHFGDGPEAEPRPEIEGAATIDDPTLGIPVVRVGDDWLRAAGDPTKPKSGTVRSSVLPLVAEVAGDEPVDTTEVAEEAVERGLVQSPETVRSTISNLYQMGLFDRRKKPGGGTGMAYEYRLSPVGEQIAQSEEV